MKTFIGNNHATERRSEENVIFRGEERSDKIKIGRKKKEKDETASSSTPQLSIDAQMTTLDMKEEKVIGTRTTRNI